MSVSSFNSTTTAIFYYYLLPLQIYRCVQLNSVLFSSPWSSMLVVINKIHWCVAVCAINCTVDRRSCCSHFSSHRTDSQIFAENRDFCLPRLDSTPPWRGRRRNITKRFGAKKLEWVATRRWKKFEDIFICFDRIHERDRQTDRQTDGHRVTVLAALMHIIARQKN